MLLAGDGEHVLEEDLYRLEQLSGALALACYVQRTLHGLDRVDLM